MPFSDLDPYSPPGADFDQGSLVHKILSEQSMLGIIVGCLAAGIPSAIIYALIVATYPYPIPAYLLPGIIIGYTARYCGRTFEFRFRLVTGAMTLVLLIELRPANKPEFNGAKIAVLSTAIDHDPNIIINNTAFLSGYHIVPFTCRSEAIYWLEGSLK